MPPSLALKCQNNSPLKIYHFLTDSTQSYPKITTVITPNLAVPRSRQINSTRSSRRFEFIFYIKLKVNLSLSTPRRHTNQTNQTNQSANQGTSTCAEHKSTSFGLFSHYCVLPHAGLDNRLFILY